MYDDLPAPDRPLTDYESSIYREALAGFPAEQDRLADTLRLLAYYNLQGGKFVERVSSDYGDIPVESTGLTTRCVDLLCSLTYNPPPRRAILNDPEADAFYQAAVQINDLDSVMHVADRLSTLCGFFAIEAVPSFARQSVRLQSWNASEIILRADEDDSTAIGHVITRDTDGSGRLRYTWWSKDFRIVFIARQSGPFATSGGRSTQEVMRTVNPYQRLPFAFVHASPPVSDMTVSGLGPFLADNEAAIDQARYLMSRGFARYLLPRPWVGGVEANWQPVAGDEYIRIPAGQMREGSATPTMGYLQAAVDFAGGELHIDRMLSRVLEAVGIPESLYIMEQTTAISGDAIEAQSRPVVDRARNRQACLKIAEGEVAEIILVVGGTSLGRPELHAAGLGNASLTVEWPEDLVSVPGADQDTQDNNALALGLISKVDLTRRRFRLPSDEAAVRHLLKVQKDNMKLRELGIDPGVDLPPSPASNPLPIEDPSSGVFYGESTTHTEVMS